MCQIWSKRAAIRKRKPRNAVAGATSWASIFKVNLAAEKQFTSLRRNLWSNFLRWLRQRLAAKVFCIAGRKNQHRGEDHQEACSAWVQ